MDNSGPIDLIKFLMHNHSLKISDLSKVLDISNRELSNILDGKERLNNKVIEILCQHFKLRKEAFKY